MDGGGYDRQTNNNGLRLLNDRYKLYLRHHSEGILETVMFFIPLARKSMGADL